jgi:hypothetical protein
MWQLLITVTVCAQSIPLDQCTPRNAEARAVIAYAAPEGVMLCGLPSTVVTNGAGPGDGEYAKTRCELRRIEG